MIGQQLSAIRPPPGLKLGEVTVEQRRQLRRGLVRMQRLRRRDREFLATGGRYFGLIGLGR